MLWQGVGREFPGDTFVDVCQKCSAPGEEGQHKWDAVQRVRDEEHASERRLRRRVSVPDRRDDGQREEQTTLKVPVEAVRPVVLLLFRVIVVRRLVYPAGSVRVYELAQLVDEIRLV